MISFFVFIFLLGCLIYFIYSINNNNNNNNKNKNNSTYIILFIFLLITVSFLYFYTLHNKYFFEKFMNSKEYKLLMLNNNKEKLYKISLDNNIPIEREDCYDKCNKNDCIKMDDKISTLSKCLKCNEQKHKCFKKDILGGSCNDCNGEDEKINCYELQNFGCTDPSNLDSNIGINPYFIKVPDNSITSHYNKKCVFCWNILYNI